MTHPFECQLLDLPPVNRILQNAHHDDRQVEEYGRDVPFFTLFVFPHEEKRRSPHVAIQRERLAFRGQQRGWVSPLPTLLGRLIQTSLDEVLSFPAPENITSKGRNETCAGCGAGRGEFHFF